MLNSQSKSPNRLSRWLKFFIVFVLVIGIFLRFAGLDKKVYWLDEVATSFRLGGYTITEVSQQVYDGKIKAIGDLQKYQKTDPEKNLASTVQSLIVDDSQHTPLYYIMVRLWAELVGNAPALLRILSVAISLLIFPCFYWLCLELSDSVIFSWIVLALTSVSLLHITYAQEAREYSLWIVMILFSSTSFLRALRLQTKLSFGIYTASIILGFYTFPLTGLVLLGQAIYVAVVEKFRLTKTSIYFLISSTIGVLFFLPWIAILLTNSSRVSATTSWMYKNNSLQDLIYIWSVNLTLVLVHYSRFRIFFLILFLYSLYLLYRKSSQRIWLFILTLTAPTLIIFTLSDLFFKTSLSFTPRYLWPFLIGTQLVFAYALSYTIETSNSNENWLKRNWLKTTGILFFTLTLIVSFSVPISSVIGSNNSQFHLAADIINKSNSPLIVSFINNKKNIAIADIGEDIGDIGDIFSLSYLIQDKTKVLLFKQPNIPEIPKGFSDIFMFYVYKTKVAEKEPDLQGIINQGYQLEPIVLKEGDKTILWKINMGNKSSVSLP